MRIDKAIELLICANEGWPASNAEKYYKALELGIEALKRVKEYRLPGLVRHYFQEKQR